MAVIKNDKLVQNIVDSWAKEESLYKKLEEIIYTFLKEEITSTELFPAIYHRVKDPINMVKTALKKDKTYKEINDKLGFRLVTHFKSELEPIKDFLNSNFSVVYYESKSEKLKYNELGYVSDHFEVKIKPDLPYFSQYKHFRELIFEIQVRTICQHAWADVEHALSYKQDIELDEFTKRKIFRLTSLLEICDDEFDSVNAELLTKPEFIIFYILKKIEGKFYKFAKRRFDKDLSFENITLLKTLLGKNSEIQSQMKDINDFVLKNEERIEQIFSERQKELRTNIFLTQPEIFIIWYLIENKEFELISHWQNNLDIQELYDLSVMWGKPITIKE